MATKHASLSNFAKGTVITEADVEVTNAVFAMFDYSGSRTAVPALVVTYKTTNGEVYEQNYTVGSPTDYAPSKDGNNLDVLSDREKIHEQTNYAHFIEALKKAGFPSKTIDDADGINVIVGTKGHVRQETVKRTGGNVKAETSLLVFSQVTSLPGESKSASGALAGADDNVSAKANQIMIELLSAEGTLERKKLLPLVIKSDTYKDKDLDKDTKTAILNLIKSDDFMLGSADWTVDKAGVVSLGG